MSKIFERHVHLALYEYLNQLGLLFKYQSGFRLFYSCETAMIELVDRLLMNMDNGLLTGLSLIDFRKAFDLVDHEVLLRKLVVYQLSEESIQWLKSYLEERLQKSFHQWCDVQLPSHNIKGSTRFPSGSALVYHFH